MQGRSKQAATAQIEGDGFRVAAPAPGSREAIVPPGTVHVALNLADAPTDFVLEDGAATDGRAPARSFAVLPAVARPRRLRTGPAGPSLALALAPDLLDADPVLRMLLEDRPPLLHALDPTMLALGDMLHTRLTEASLPPSVPAIRALVVTMAARAVHCLRDAETADEADWPDSVQAATLLMAGNLDRPLSLAAIAAHVGVSQYHFARLFRQATGHSVHQHLVMLRVGRAEHLLRETTLPLAEIAYEAGFGSQSHMTNVLRRATGRTPGALRRIGRVAEGSDEAPFG